MFVEERSSLRSSLRYVRTLLHYVQSRYVHKELIKDLLKIQSKVRVRENGDESGFIHHSAASLRFATLLRSSFTDLVQ